jgi:hypothetical protein
LEAKIKVKRTVITRLFRAEIARLVKLPGLYISIAVATALSLPVLIQSADLASSLEIQYAFSGISVLQIALLVWGAQYGASAYESGSITRFAFIAGGKTRALAIRLAALGLAIVFAVAVTFALSLVITVVLSASQQKSFGWASLLWAADGRILLAVAWFTLTGFFAGVLTRSRAVSSAGTLALVLVPSVFLLLTMPDLAQWMPLAIASRFVTGPETHATLGVTFAQSILVMLAILATFAAGGWLRAIARSTKKAKP